MGSVTNFPQTVLYKRNAKNFELYKWNHYQINEGYFSSMQRLNPELNFAILISWSWL